ncbi:MAG: thioredoxin [Candidatus Omnitrophica bacterium]|nr:thioredoxin [Candidatus Omnitrophota bacterium]MBF0620018.1 thioredoxin [Candidatus Omnitrophota bacterium]
MSNAVKITADNFEAEVLKSTTLVLADFWAEWCGPCKMVLPIMDQIAVEMAGQVKVCKINVDDNQELAADFNVMSIPTMIIFKGGKPVDQMVGALPKIKIVEKLKAQL